MTFADPATLVQLALLGVGAALAVSDLLIRKLPNWLVGCLLVLSCLHAVLTLGWVGFAWAATHGLAALAVGALLFGWKVIGAGDAKFYAAIAVGVPWSGALGLLWWTSIGGLLLLLALAVNILAGRRKKDTQVSVPFGVAIYVGLAGPLFWEGMQGLLT